MKVTAPTTAPTTPATSLADPHPGFLRSLAETRRYLLGRPSRIMPTPDGKAVLFLRSPARSPVHGLHEYDVATAATREVVTPAEILGGAGETLSEAEKARRERMRITDRGFASFGLSPDGATVLLVLSNRLYLFDRASRKTRALTEATTDAVVDPRFSPDGTRIAFVRGHDVWVADVAGKVKAHPVTTGGSENLTHGLAEFVAQEEMGRFEGWWWSPDGKRIAYTEADHTDVERFAIADAAHPERAPAVFPYPRPGKANARVRLGIVAAGATGKAPRTTRWIDWDRDKYPYLALVLWEGVRAPMCVLVQTRDQREAVMLAVDDNTLATRPLAIERDDAWVNLDKDLPRWLPDGRGFLWVTEHSGRRELELRAPDGATKTIVVPASEGFVSLCHVDPAGREAWVLTGDAISNRIVRVPLDSDVRVVLTRDRAEHAPVFARRAGLYVDTVTAADAWPESFVCRADGSVLGRLPSTAETPPFRVNLELTTVGAPGFHAAVIRPHDLRPGRRYPVIVYVYGGPHALVVKADARNYLYEQWLADHGVIVVAIDNRGSPRRDRVWERAIKGNFADVALADQVLALQALGARYPEMDLSRVGIHGWSFGGYMAALAVLRRPDIYKAAVAGAPVVDWLDYDTHYTERYLDLPAANTAGYRDSGLLAHAPKLSRPLLLVHGTADDNVYTFHSLKLADALLRAGRPFEYLPLPGVTHQIGDPVVREQVWRRTADFLFAHLGVGA